MFTSRSRSGRDGLCAGLFVALVPMVALGVPTPTPTPTPAPASPVGAPAAQPGAERAAEPAAQPAKPKVYVPREMPVGDEWRARIATHEVLQAWNWVKTRVAVLRRAGEQVASIKADADAAGDELERAFGPACAALEQELRARARDADDLLARLRDRDLPAYMAGLKFDEGELKAARDAGRWSTKALPTGVREVLLAFRDDFNSVPTREWDAGFVSQASASLSARSRLTFRLPSSWRATTDPNGPQGEARAFVSHAGHGPMSITITAQDAAPERVAKNIRDLNAMARAMIVSTSTSLATGETTIDGRDAAWHDITVSLIEAPSTQPPATNADEPKVRFEARGRQYFFFDGPTFVSLTIAATWRGPVTDLPAEGPLAQLWTHYTPTIERVVESLRIVATEEGK